ncbi:NAD(P)-dependent oxidoreductase [Azospirillum sp. TSO22-1]|uniref:NAD(P)-dependent oxidoreductase n=1 Tax=Azospirillum sp. TSO22-1 TaxID=716789 RepID=UPI000D60D8D0|nr:NAD(P)-dependent oxidoreductase [Azospirillum sp. TSO22-1]PWC56013.1 2-hydroxy-3-oxopropionate reductase [Azospirillum sp. TSO22-1]
MSDATAEQRPDLSGRTVGLIGLGLMGRPMARNLARAGARVVVHNRSRGPVDELAAEGMVPAADPAGVAQAADTLILMLTDTPAVEAVIDALLGALTSGHLVIDMGTTAVGATRRLAERVRAAGAEWVDAPVSGGQVAAEATTLTIMAGGTETAFARALPLFQALGRRITHVGNTGAGQIAKTANQVIVGLTIGAVAEALALAKAAGADPAKVREAIRGGFAESRILELHGGRMVSGDFAPGARATTQLKDLTQAEALAEEAGIDLPAVSLCKELYELLVDKGDGGLDHAALYRLFS